MHEKTNKSGVGRPLGSIKPKVSAQNLVKLRIEVSQVQLKQLDLMVERGVGKSREAIIENWVSAEITKRREEGKTAPEATILPFEKSEKNSPTKKEEVVSQSN